MVTVTASRTPLEIRETGSSVTIITREQILRRNASNLAELLREIPGIAVSQQGAFGSVSQVRIRGAEANHVLVLIDGVEVNDIAQGSEFNFAHLLVSFIERVEIVRGPQSALWGSDALAGVINVITRPSGGTTSAIDASLEAGSFGTIRGSASVQHGNEKHQVRVYLDVLETDGSNIARAGPEDDGYRNRTLNLTGLYTPGKAEISYNVRATNSRTEFDDIDFFTTGLPVDADFLTQTQQRYAGAAITFDLLDGHLEQVLSIARTDTENVNRTLSPTHDTTRGIKDQLQAQSNLYWGDHVFTAVLELEEERYRQRGAVSFFGDPNKNLNTNTLSAAVEYRYDAHAFDLSFSARHDNNSDFDSANSWRATLAWHLRTSTSLFTSIGESIKNPTFTERFGFFNTFQGNRHLTPEESLGWEIGLRHAVFNDRGTFSVSLHGATLDNEINGFVFDPPTNTFTARNVSGDSERSGAELQLSVDLSEVFSISAAYSYLDATQEDPGGNIIEEVRRPKNSASVSANFSFSRGNLNLSVIHNGKQKDDYFPPFPPFQEKVQLDRYTLVNVSGNYRVSANVLLTARIENLFDEDYEEVFGFASPGFGAHSGIRISF